MALSSGCQPTIYGSPNLYYGIGAQYGGCYDPALTAHNATPAQPSKPAVTIRFYDNTKSLRAYVSSNTWINPISKLTFEKHGKGCGRCSLELLELPPLAPEIITEHGSWFEVHLWNNPSPIWSGTVTKTPGAGTTENVIKLEGLGFIDMADDVIIADLDNDITKVLYEDTSIRDVVLALATSLETNTYIVKDAAKVEDSVNSEYEPSLFYIRTKISEALDELAELAGGWVWGVDANRDLYFHQRDTSITSERTLIVGHDLEEWKPVEDSSRIQNFLHVRHGQTNVDVTDPAFGTNFLAGYVDDTASRTAHGTREGIVSAPSIYSQLDAYRFAAARLERLKNPVTRGLAPKLTFTGTEFEAGKNYRVISGDTVADLVCKRVKYTVKPSGRVECQLYLGDEEDDLARWAVDLVTLQARNDAEARLNQFQNVEARPPQ